MTLADNQNPQLTARQAQRMLYFLGHYRQLLHERENPAFTVDPREAQIVSDLIAEVKPAIWPAPNVPPLVFDRNGNTR